MIAVRPYVAQPLQQGNSINVSELTNNIRQNRNIRNIDRINAKINHITANIDRSPCPAEHVREYVREHGLDMGALEYATSENNTAEDFSILKNEDSFLLETGPSKHILRYSYSRDQIVSVKSNIISFDWDSRQWRNLSEIIQFTEDKLLQAKNNTEISDVRRERELATWAEGFSYAFRSYLAQGFSQVRNPTEGRAFVRQALANIKNSGESEQFQYLMLRGLNKLTRTNGLMLCYEAFYSVNSTGKPINDYECYEYESNESYIRSLVRSVEAMQTELVKSSDDVRAMAELIDAIVDKRMQDKLFHGWMA